MNWLLKATIYIIAALVFGIVDAALASILGIKTLGSMGAKIVQSVVTAALSWGLLLTYLKLNGGKITWPN